MLGKIFQLVLKRRESIQTTCQLSWKISKLLHFQINVKEDPFTVCILASAPMLSKRIWSYLNAPEEVRSMKVKNLKYTKEVFRGSTIKPTKGYKPKIKDYSLNCT